MRVISFQAEEGREWVDQEEKREDRMDEHLKKVQTFPPETEIGHEEKEGAIPEKTSVLPAEKKEWRHSPAVSQQEKKEKEENETEEVVMEKADNQLKKLATDGQTRPEENEMVQTRVLPRTKNVSVSGLSSENSTANASRNGSGTTTISTRISSLGIDDDYTSNHSSAENVSTAVIHIIKSCPDSDKISCSATNGAIKRERGSNMYPAISAESFTPYNVKSTSGTNRVDSVWDSRVDESPLGSRLETITGTHSATGNFEIDPAGLLDVRKSVKSRLGSDKLDTLLWSEQVKSVNTSVDTTSDRIPGQTGGSVNSKGPHGDDDMLHSLQIRGLESEQTAHPAWFRDPICVDGLLVESDLDSGIEEGEALHPSQFTGAVKTKKEVQEFGTITRPCSVSSGSVSSEQMHQDSPSHYAVVTITTTLQGSESSQMSDREWAEIVPGWGMQSLGFVVEQPTQVEEELRQEVMDDFY